MLTCFSPEDGLLTALLRPPRGPAIDTAPTPDLFDRLALDLNHGRSAPSGGPWFVREHRLLIRHTAIGRDYPTLAAASRLARLVSRNPVPEDSRIAIDTLLSRAFETLGRADARPDLVYFKSIYCLARDEGLPLKQAWLPSLPVGDRSLVGIALNQPASSPDLADADLGRLTKRLEGYLSAEHDLRFG